MNDAAQQKICCLLSGSNDTTIESEEAVPGKQQQYNFYW